MLGGSDEQAVARNRWRRHDEFTEIVLP